MIKWPTFGNQGPFGLFIILTLINPNLKKKRTGTVLQCKGLLCLQTPPVLGSREHVWLVREQVSPVCAGRWTPFSKFGSLTFETYFIIIIINYFYFYYYKGQL